jgi:hypothetical protein
VSRRMGGCCGMLLIGKRQEGAESWMGRVEESPACAILLWRFFHWSM